MGFEWKSEEEILDDERLSWWYNLGRYIARFGIPLFIAFLFEMALVAIATR